MLTSERAPSEDPLSRTAALLCLLISAACQREDAPLWIAPLDGASGFDRSAPLRVSVGDLRLPDDPALPAELLEVIDLQDGGFVEGERAYDGASLWFTPVEPWASERDYLWVVRQPEARARQPSIELRPEILGEATFTTRAAPTLLEGVVDDDALCLLFSAPVPGDEPQDLTLGAEPLGDAAWAPRDPELGSDIDPDGLSPAGVTCVDGDFSGALGQNARWTSPEGAAVSFPLVRGRVRERLEQRHRFTEAP